MHQQFRRPPRGSSPASNPQTNPTRTNNPRDPASSNRSRGASESPAPGPSIPAGGGEAANQQPPAAPPVQSAPGGPTRESIKKLDQIIQNFHLKAAVLIVQSRVPVTPSGGSRGKKTNKWFQIETDDIDDFKDELRTWKHCGSFDNRPPPMIIETYLDASRLTPGQTLVVVDENGKRWDALEALNTAEFSSGSGSSSHGSGRSDSNNNGSSNKMRTKSTEIILERWKVELQCIPSLSKSSSAGSGGGSSRGVGAGSSNTEDKGAKTEGSNSSTSADIIDMDDFGPILPTIYKRSIVFFRSLFVTTHVLPAYRFSHQVTSKGVHPALKVCCRVLTGAAAEARVSSSGFDNLRQPLVFDGARDVVTDYMFGDLEVPIGRFSASVTYRNDCSFRVVDSESLLSSRFMGIDENYFRPSLPQTQRPDNTYLPQQYQQQQQSYGQQGSARRESSAEVVGSLPSQQRRRNVAEPRYEPQPPQQTYGSLSTFHGAGALGTSPLSALKAVRPLGSESSSPTDSVRPSSVEQRPQLDPPNSLPITAGQHHMASAAGTSSGGARAPALRNLDGIGRRTSVSFQPFKAGSLSGSPRMNQDEIPPSSPLSGSRPTSGMSALAQARHRNSLTAGMAASLRGAPIVSTSAGSSAAAGVAAIDPGQSSSPRPSAGSRYSSSFTHRRGKSSFGGASRNEDEQGSSGKQSLSSSMAQPGSGLLAEAGGGGSSGSFQTDDDNISDFLKALESKKTLQSFEASNRRGESARRTAAQLSRFQNMRESNVALTDSMNSSMQLQTRQQVHGTSGVSGVSATSSTSGGGGGGGSGSGAVPVSHTMSASQSPNKPLSPHTPHTPHTPAVPSRLSENSIIEYQGQTQRRERTSGHREVSSTAEEGEDASKEGGGTTAIDIPLSPRLRHATDRRSSSAAQKPRALIVDDDADLAAFGGQRSLSVGADGREEPPSLSTLFRLEQEGPRASSSSAAAAAAVAAAGTVRASSLVTGAAGPGSKTGAGAAASMPPAPAAVAAALRSGVTAGTSQRRRYISRNQQQAQQIDSPAAHGSDGRPTPPASSGASISGSYIGRYGSGRGSGVASSNPSALIGGHGGDGEADDEPLVFDLLDLEQSNRHSLEEARGAGTANSGPGAPGTGHYSGHHQPW